MSSFILRSTSSPGWGGRPTRRKHDRRVAPRAARRAVRSGGLWRWWARAAVSASARSAHGRRDHGRACPARTPVPLPAVPRDSDGPSTRRNTSTALQRDGDRVGLRDVRPVGSEPWGDASAYRAMAFGRAGVAGDGSMAGRRGARGHPRSRAPLPAAMVSPPAGRAVSGMHHLGSFTASRSTCSIFGGSARSSPAFAMSAAAIGPFR